MSESPSMDAPNGKDRAEEAGKMPGMSAQEHQGQDLAGAHRPSRLESPTGGDDFESTDVA